VSRHAGVAGLAWLAANAPGYWRYRRALPSPEGVQRSLLLGTLRSNADTAFGRAHGFARVRTTGEYQSRVPLSGHEDYLPWLERVARGERGVLTEAPVVALQPSGGTSGAAKVVPYTRALQAEFRRAVAPWVFDLYRSRPGLALGASYWSITPALQGPAATGSGIPADLQEDAEYLGGFWHRLVGATLAVPADVKDVGDAESFRYVTLLFLLRRGDLRLVSVWHPSFLTLLLDALPRHWDDLVTDVGQGTLRPPTPLEPGLQARLGARRLPAPRRAAALRRCVPDQPTRIWPQLRLVSCWGDGHAALHLASLRRRLPGVEIQPKGLMATEACVTLPFAGAMPLAVRSHFFEFVAGERAWLAHQLEPGGIYSVVVTTGGGLYRYRLEDRVRVEGFVGRTPSLRFLGKEDHVSDLCGEKLDEGFVAGVLRDLFDAVGLKPRFALLAPELSPTPSGYALYLEVDSEPPPALAALLEQRLRASPGYRYCAALGQLAPARVVRVGVDAFPRYLQRLCGRGQRMGDVKALALSPLAGWSEVFAAAEDRRPRSTLRP
jgi:hypothetical protein